ncbi:Bud-site selection protein [Neurospora tetraspora]|uniref:Bud-site selection protein n=1 Tax=Neurospora tetraspora TaxID=94610 RepID=A0AAE0JCM9_9PEZI|nr:Bud-site selection protein [Neurospora tetraspora]
MQSLGKRKRTEEEDVEKVFTKYWGELHHALKTAKGFERQRQSKRLHDRSTPQDKKARIENEIVVLKSLDLYQAAHAHLCFSLLRIKRIAECPNLPEAVKRGVSKPMLTEEERTALHNVTSALCARQEVRTVTDKAIVGICKAMGIEPPEKKGKKGKNQPKEKEGLKTEEAKENRDNKTTKDKKEEEKKDTKVDKKAKEKGKKDDKPTEKTKTKEKPAKKEAVAEQNSDHDEEPVNEEEEEKVLSKYDDLLGGSSSESDADDEEARFASKAAVKKRPIAKELDPMEITDDEEGGYGDDLDPMEITDDEAEDGDSEQNGDGSDDEFEGFSDSEDEGSNTKLQEEQSEDENQDEEEDDSDSDNSGIDAAPSKKKSKSSSSTANTQKLQNFTMDSTFLPTLMGGYISGSESASDVDVAPARKNRRGQRARQAIWEKKFKEEAKHLKKQQNARDAGWDMKRGAVESSDGKPWKKGSLLDIKNKGKEGGEEGGEDKGGDAQTGGAGAAAARGGDRGRGGGGRGGRGGAGRGGSFGSGRGDAGAAPAPPARAPTKRDDSGPLHPSWEAKKKAKEKEMMSAPFQGKKITFD